MKILHAMYPAQIPAIMLVILCAFSGALPEACAQVVPATVPGAPPVVAPQKRAEVADAIVAVVNTEVITRREVAVRTALVQARMKAQGVQMPPAAEFQKQLLESMILDRAQTQRAAELVRKIRDRGMTVVLVEHDVPSVMRICDRIVVLNQGAKIAEGTPQEIQNNQLVIEAYLGVENDAQS